MKRELRDSYRTIAEVGNLGLCNFCKYAHFEGDCSECVLYCEHPLSVIRDDDNNDENVWAGGCDCWGFRAHYDLPTCATITSIVHDGNVAHFGRGEWIAIVPKLLEAHNG